MTFPMTTNPFTFNPLALGPSVSQLQAADSTILPISMAAKQRNAALDWLFYDVTALTPSELQFLVTETNREGSILVVGPRDQDGEKRVWKFDDHAGLRAAPGKLLEHFAIAGVGSSDIGAAAFARNVADYYGEPVGAIVAGYGVVDVLAEAMGGWFFLGKSNQMMKLFHDANPVSEKVAEEFKGSIPSVNEKTANAIADHTLGSPDSQTLLKLLLDKDRTIKSLVGHSKGCLSISYALEALAVSGAKASLAKARRIRCVTTGAVIEFPSGFDDIVQCLGSLDWFGSMNSRRGLDYESIPNAWHHLNTAIPFHMNLHTALDIAEG